MRVTLTRPSPCKVNLLLNILGRRPDGFHALETVMQPVNVCDTLHFTRGGTRVQLTCDAPGLPVDSRNLVVRAAEAFRAAAGVAEGVQVYLEKRLPLAAGLGGGSANAAVTLRALNELFGHPLDPARLTALAAELGSDVPFFLQDGPALATGRGELVQPLPPFRALRGTALLLAHPGFGVETVWAYRELARFPAALHGEPGRAQRLIAALNGTDLMAAARDFYNALEAPVLAKFPVLALYQDFFRQQGAAVALMSGSGSTTFAVFPSRAAAEAAQAPFQRALGGAAWLAVADL